MAKNKISFGGFDGQQNGEPNTINKEKDLPPRDLPKPIDTKPAPSWNIELKKNKKETTIINSGVINIVNLLLPVIGLTILIGGIVSVSFFVFNIYN